MNETQQESEARWAASRARQEAYRNSPEAKAKRAERIAAGLCVHENVTLNGVRGTSWCVTHDVAMDLGHDLDINGYTRADGTARND